MIVTVHFYIQFLRCIQAEFGYVITKLSMKTWDERISHCLPASTYQILLSSDGSWWKGGGRGWGGAWWGLNQKISDRFLRRLGGLAQGIVNRVLTLCDVFFLPRSVVVSANCSMFT